ncbi:MAG: hypothetical protein Q9173_002233 [Seirophora scorigena]
MSQRLRPVDILSSFPLPKRFANALLRSHDITALIRDTEVHERALFRFAPPDPSSLPRHVRRTTAYGPKTDQGKLSNSTDLLRPGHKHSAVSTILGGELGQKLRNDGTHAGKERGEVDEAAIPIPGAKEKISSLHSRFNQLTASVTRYENRVSKNATQLAKLNRSGDDRDADDEHLDPGASPDLESGEGKFSELPITAEQLEREEQEVRELERRKQNLEERVSGMERDLGGLLR